MLFFLLSVRFILVVAVLDLTGSRGSLDLLSLHMCVILYSFPFHLVVFLIRHELSFTHLLSFHNFIHKTIIYSTYLVHIFNFVLFTFHPNLLVIFSFHCIHHNPHWLPYKYVYSRNMNRCLIVLMFLLFFGMVACEYDLPHEK